MVDLYESIDVRALCSIQAMCTVSSVFCEMSIWIHALNKRAANYLRVLNFCDFTFEINTRENMLP